MQVSRLIRGIALTDQIGQDVEITSLTSGGAQIEVVSEGFYPVSR